MAAAVERPIEREYRNLVSDNRRWQRFVPRSGDIFVCTPAKCGTTWMQTIVATLLFPAGDAPGGESPSFSVCMSTSSDGPSSSIVARSRR